LHGWQCQLAAGSIESGFSLLIEDDFAGGDSASQRETPKEQGEAPKPFSPEALAAAVRQVLGPPRPARTVLIVDDEPGIRNFLREVLTNASYEVLEAENGEEAIKQVAASNVDLVIMDLAMPKQEGLETIPLLRQLRPRLRIIVMSGKFASQLHAAELLGANASLAKPIPPAGLLDLVARVMAS
jgi:CheY-like chemotaxis protein